MTTEIFFNPPPRNLNSQQIVDKEQVFSGLSQAEQDVVWEALHAYFRATEVSEDRKFWHSYFRWYTDLTWQRLQIIHDVDFIGVAIFRQIPMAFLLGRDVWKDTIWYLYFYPLDKEDLRRIYQKAKEIFLDSPAIIGLWQGKEITVAEVIKEISDINDKGNNSLELADLKTRLKSMLYPKDEPLTKYLIADPDTAVGNFIDLVHFFLGITPDTIGYIVDAFIHPEQYGEEKPLVNTASAASKIALNVNVSKAPAPSFEPRKAPAQTNLAIKKEAPKKLSVTEIKATIEKKFPKDAQNQYTDIAGVLAALQTMAEEQNDPSIADWYYFDENVGKFKWSV